MSNITLPKQNKGNFTQGWLQVDKLTHQKMWQFGLKKPAALSVLMFLTSRLNRGTNGVIMSYKAISETMGISESTSKRAINDLSKAKFIQVLKSGSANIYVINSRVAWQGKRGQRYANFNAEITLTESEQTRSVDELIAESEELPIIPKWDDDERILVGNEKLPPPDQQEMELP